MKTPINQISSEINVSTGDDYNGNVNDINQMNTLSIKARPRIVATRAARQARRASRYGA